MQKFKNPMGVLKLINKKINDRFLVRKYVCQANKSFIFKGENFLSFFSKHTKYRKRFTK